MEVDIRLEPECVKEGTFCENCGERVEYLSPKCVCGESVVWIDQWGKRHEHWYPRTEAARYFFSLYRISEFSSKRERDRWEELEKKWGPEPLAAWSNWSLTKHIGGRRAVSAVLTCVERHGEPRGEYGLEAGSSSSGDVGGEIQEVCPRDAFLSGLGKEYI